MKNVLSIAGTDPTGGAGIQTDLKTFEAHGVYGMAVISAVVAQNTFHVTGMQAVPADLVGRQIDCVFEDIRPDAVKIGMLYDEEIIHKTAECLRAHHAKNIVLDPVMMSSSGQVLLRRDATETLIRELFPLCTLVTPNLHEAAAICLTVRPVTGFPRRASTTPTPTAPAARCPPRSPATSPRDILLRRVSAAPSSISPPASPMVSISAAAPVRSSTRSAGNNFRKTAVLRSGSQTGGGLFSVILPAVPAAAFEIRHRRAAAQRCAPRRSGRRPTHKTAD